MIIEYSNSINVILGDGDIGIGVVGNQDKQAYGIGFRQLTKKHDVGSCVGDHEDESEDIKRVTILFANKQGIESLMLGIQRFLAKLAEEEAEEEK